VIVNEKISHDSQLVYFRQTQRLKKTYAIPGKPLLMSTMMFTIEPPLSPIHSLKAKQSHMARNILQYKINNYIIIPMRKSIQLRKTNSPNITTTTTTTF